MKLGTMPCSKINAFLSFTTLMSSLLPLWVSSFPVLYYPHVLPSPSVSFPLSCPSLPSCPPFSLCEFPPFLSFTTLMSSLLPLWVSSFPVLHYPHVLPSPSVSFLLSCPSLPSCPPFSLCEFPPFLSFTTLMSSLLPLWVSSFPVLHYPHVLPSPSVSFLLSCPSLPSCPPFSLCEFPPYTNRFAVAESPWLQSDRKLAADLTWRLQLRQEHSSW